MTKQEILDNFNDINFVYNDSSRYETLSRMLDELLKEREPVKPIRINTITDGFSFAYACGKCCYFLPRIGIAAKYCTNCGTAVKWNEAD